MQHSLKIKNNANTINEFWEKRNRQIEVAGHLYREAQALLKHSSNPSLSVILTKKIMLW